MADLAETVFTAVRGYVDRELAKLGLKFDEQLRSALASIQPPEKGDKGERGEPGKDADAGAIEAKVSSGIIAFVTNYLRELPKAKDGERGERGEKGERGERGEPGLSVKGDPGERGEPGPAGPRGEAGLSVKGDPGERGEKGNDGVSIKGEKGDKGDSIRGERGEPGPRGEPGLSIKGDPGEKGDKGDAGLSAFQIAKASGFVGSEGEWLLSLRGKDGETPRDGREGPRGERGRDACELDITAGIDHSRAYPKGTFAAFYGGLFFAVRETDPLRGNDKPTLAGWHPAMNGIKSDLETLEDGGRWRVRTVTMADGTVSVQKQKTKMQIYRGVYKAGHAYDEGDVVTDYGCEWAALEDNKERPKQRDITKPQAWALCVKGGKDGRDAINGRSSLQ